VILDDVVLLAVLLVEVVVEDLFLVLDVLRNNPFSLRVVVLLIVFDVSNQVQCDSVFLQRTHVFELAKRDFVLFDYVKSVLE
jgi:hypothetical protein